ncbi:DUF3969 family protein [Bacillus pumilus]|nr:DUF3969 family protein [Bacillus pumilus]
MEIMCKLTINHSTQEALDKIVAIQILGVITALEEDVLTIEEAEKIIFSPRTMDVLKASGASELLLNLLHLGTELEDIESLIPHELDTSLDEIKMLSIDLLKKRAETKLV